VSEALIVEVADIVEEAAGIRSLRLRKLDGTPFTPFEAGAHIDVTGPTGVLRQYSLASDPRDSSSIVIAVKREATSRGGSVAMHDVSIGDRLRIGWPRNLFALAERADRHLLVAGGIGVTPLLSMAYALHARGADFRLVYFARTRDDVAFGDLLQNRAEFHDRVQIHIGVPRTGHKRVLASLAADLTAESHVYTCGPVGFMDQVATLFGSVVGDDHVHVEHFVADAVNTSADRAFRVEVDGRIYDVPAGKSILAVLEENGIDVFKSCEEGVCGSCISGVLEGTPDHRDHCLSAADKAANKEMALCVSRALSEKLVIELY